MDLEKDVAADYYVSEQSVVYKHFFKLFLTSLNKLVPGQMIKMV